jgi:hypothetical protein
MERSEFSPGDYVRHPRQPEWGLGQVQSAIGNRVTVMFENAGKVLIDTDVVALDKVDGDEDLQRGGFPPI